MTKTLVAQEYAIQRLEDAAAELARMSEIETARKEQEKISSTAAVPQKMIRAV